MVGIAGQWRILMGILLLGGMLAASGAMAAEHGQEEAAEQAGGESTASALRVAGVALAIGVVMLGAALGTAKVQAAIGAGGTGLLAEKPELFVSVVVLIAIPETILVLGFVMAFLLYRLVA